MTEKKNPEGYHDLTAFEAIKNVEQLENRQKFLIKVLKFIISQSGFILMNRIELQDKQTGRVFK